MSRLFFLVPLISVLPSCIRRDDSILPSETVRTQVMEDAMKTIGVSSMLNMKSLDDKSHDYKTSEKAGEWNPKAIRTVQLVKRINDSLFAAQSRPFTGIESSKSLKKIIRSNLDSIQAIEPRFKEEFKNEFCRINQQTDILLKDENETLATRNELNISWKERLQLLRLSLARLENQLTAFCDNVCTAMYCGFDSYYPLVSQNSTIFSPGQQIEINAGIGYFSKAAQPTFRIKGKTTTVNEAGFSRFKERVPDKPGHYTVPVTISYFNQLTGKTETATIKVEYDVKN